MLAVLLAGFLRTLLHVLSPFLHRFLPRQPFLPFSSSSSLSSSWSSFVNATESESRRQMSRVRKRHSPKIFSSSARTFRFFFPVNNIILKKYLLDKHRLEKKSLRFFLQEKKIRWVFNPFPVYNCSQTLF